MFSETTKINIICWISDVTCYTEKISNKLYFWSQNYYPEIQLWPNFKFLDYMIILWLLGMLWHDAKNIYYHGLRQFIARQGNILTILLQITFISSFSVKLHAWRLHNGSLAERADWPSNHPTLISEALFD